MTELRGVFFDAFRTLIELQPTYPGAFAAVCRDFGYDVAETEVAHVLPAIERAAEQQARVQTNLRCSSEDLSRRWVALNEAIFRGVGIDGDASALSAEMERRFNLGTYTRAYHDALPTLEILAEAGLRLGVISNGTPGVAHCLDLAGIAARVEFVLVSALVGWEKPAPQIFRAGLEAVGLVPEQVVFIGDHYDADILGARAVGMQAVLIDRAGAANDLDCPIVRDLVEFRQWLDGRITADTR